MRTGISVSSFFNIKTQNLLKRILYKEKLYKEEMFVVDENLEVDEEDMGGDFVDVMEGENV